MMVCGVLCPADGLGFCLGFGQSRWQALQPATLSLLMLNELGAKQTGQVAPERMPLLIVEVVCPSLG